MTASHTTTTIGGRRMRRRTRTARIGLVAVAAGLVALTSPMLQAQEAHSGGATPNGGRHGPKLEDVPKLTVQGRAELEKPADQARLTVGVVTEAKEASDAMKDNNRVMDDIVKAIRKVGLEEGEYETGQFRVRPQYSRRPRQPGRDWEPEIVGYEVTNELAIKTKKIELVGDLLQESNKAGANTVEVTGFDLADPRKYRGEAIREATQNAVSDAEALADAAGLELVRIVAVNLDQGWRPQPMMRTMSTARAEMDAGGSPSITAGTVTIDASVTLVYEIRTKGSAGGGS